MKSFKKALAASLALAMVVTAVPVASAEAATTAKLNTKSVTVAAGTAKKQAKNIKVTTPSTWKSVKVVASSSNKNAATVKVSGKTVKVTAVKKGTAKVTVKVTGKKSGKTVKKTLTATAKVVNAGISFKAPTDVVVGSETKLAAKACPSAAKLTYASSDETVATVDAEGTVKALKAGKTTITIKSDYGTTKTVDINVKAYVLQSVKQTKADTFEAVVLGKTSDIKASGITFTQKDANVVYPTKSVSVDKNDATKLTITTFSPLKDGKTYTVKIGDQEQEVVVSDGKIASVTVDPTTIPYGVATEINLVAKDAQGIEVEKVAFPADSSKYDFKITPNNAGGYTDGSKLYLVNKGDTATAEITYKSGKYDANGKPEGNIESGKVTITAGDQAAVNKFEVRYNSKNTDKFDKVSTDNKVAAGDTVYAYFKIKDSNDKDANYADYKVSSTDNSVLMLATDTIDTANNNTIRIVPVKEGTAYLLIKKGDAVVYSVAVTVVAGRSVASMAVDKTSVTLSNSAFLNKTEKVTATFKDQFGSDFNVNAGDVEVTCVSTSAKDANDKTLLLSTITNNASYYTTSVSGNKAEVTFKAAGLTKGSYTYKIAYKKDGKEVVARTVTVVLQAPDTTKTSSFGLNIPEKTIDMKVANDAVKEDKSITISVSQLLGGVANNDLVVNATLNDGKTTVKDIEYTIEKDGKTKKSEKAATISYDIVKFDGSGVATKAETGTYKVTVKITTQETGKDPVVKTLIDTFEVKDTQADGTMTLEKNKVDAGSVDTMISNAVKYVYGDDTYGVADNAIALTVTKVEGVTNTGVKIGDGTNGTAVASSVSLTSGQSVSVTKISVKVSVGTNLYVIKDVPVNYVITAK